jgi:hypothetical protein
MAENIVAGLFGMNPQMYGEQQRRSALQEGITLAQLDPTARGTAMTYAGARGLGNAIGGAFGIEDPQLKMISARNTIAQQIDQSDPESILKGAQMLAQMGDQQGAFALAQYARQAQVQIAEQQQRLAAGEASLASKQASLAAASRERFQADPEKVRLARAVAATKGVEGSPEYITAYNESLEKQMTPADKPETKTTIQKLQEYAATLPPGSPLLAQVQEAIKAEGSSKGTKLEVNVPAAQQAKAISKNKTDLAAQVETDAYGATDRVTLARNLKSLLPTAFTGVDSNVKLQASRVAEVFGINIQGVPDSQIIDTILGEMTIGAASKLKGALSDKDVKFLKETIGTRGLSLKTLQFVADKIETDALIDSELNEVVNKYVASGGDLNKFNFASERKDVAEKVRKDIARLAQLRSKSKTQ